MLRARPALRMAWLKDDPISPSPIRATRSKTSRDMGAPQELLQGCKHTPIIVLGTDRHAQRARESIGGNAAQDDAARFQKLVGRAGAAGGFARKVDEQEVADAGRYLKSEL